jgi:ATP-binding cassette subfamily D (ALD) protein 3
MLKNGTAIERTIITRNYRGFLLVFLNFVLAFFPISVVNNLLRYGLNELALRFRSRLTHHLYQEYLSGMYFTFTIQPDGYIIFAISPRSNPAPSSFC